MKLLLPLTVGKTDAIGRIAKANGVGSVNPYGDSVSDFLSGILAEGAPNGAQIRNAGIADLSIAESRIFEPHVRKLASPRHLSERPSSFPDLGIENAFSPGLRTISVPNGLFWNIAGCSAILTADGSSLIREYSSKYSQLASFYDVCPSVALNNATTVNGTVLVLPDDIRPLNFCHWLTDWLPRLSFLGPQLRRKDFYVITIPLKSEFQVASLAMCGITRDRVIEVNDFAAVRARELIVTSDLQRPPHPAFKASPWAISFLRSSIGMQSNLACKKMKEGRPHKIYISRSDASGRVVRNEDAFFSALSKYGYSKLSLSNLTLAEQVYCFSGATHVVGLHGAGLSHVVFLPESAQVIEIFPHTYGTPAFYVLTAGLANSYFSFVEREVAGNSRDQLDDVIIDVAEFEMRCAGLL